ncbi:E3 ubiquitin-protein ligase [Populus alba x Populus x berolinensis]|uniref:RING-type E3 ubiquitin transferase n=2 Tax=Populus TaxID=3689 RepID=A0A4U5PUD9_POPAL|nr:E3 ubiquitin-protein ligase At4g11680 isoform X2 [Populus alba]KAJ6943421.1 E3 ubiquitin-protein ligase [Populus alba x Populus x berolinensis]KAJ7004016.1 E3 ubiquitin-protein ligase [Populus alba x Populus x berolinensis]TKS01053.1 E3 ubiquitin-protein ligase [Populus alba]
MSSTTTPISTTTTTPTRTGSSDDIIDTTPFLSPGQQNEPNPNPSRRSIRRQSLRDAARFLRRASSRRMMREPSMLVRETAAEQLEERQSDWAYSKPVVILDIIWNFAFVAVAAGVLVLSRKENPGVPLRLWILGYGLQCVLHMVCVCVEYRRRRRRRVGFGGGGGDGGIGSDGNSSSGSRGDYGEYVSLAQLEDDGTSSVAKHLESANTMFSFIWWIIGFYWVSTGGQALADGSHRLYWLCIVFLGFDVFFVVFCVALACVIGIAVCCCLPCIIAILYAVTDQEGASKEDIDQLAKFKFRRDGDIEKLTGDEQGCFGGIMTECGTDSPMEHVLSGEDAECCICLSAYEDGAELRQLPCSHHFHCTCVDKWLYINATCPLCKYNILKSTSQDREEV